MPNQNRISLFSREYLIMQHTWLWTHYTFFMGVAQNSKCLTNVSSFSPWMLALLFHFSLHCSIKISGKLKIDNIGIYIEKNSPQKCNTIMNQEGEHGADKSVNFQLQFDTYWGKLANHIYLGRKRAHERTCTKCRRHIIKDDAETGIPWCSCIWKIYLPSLIPITFDSRTHFQ